MDFLKLLRSAEDALYELMMWLLLYPLTLWRILRHPARLADKIREEFGQDDEQRFDDAISPPMCLLASLGISALIPDAAGSSEGLNTLGRWLTNNNYNEWLFFAALFALLPLFYATLTLLHRGQAIRRDNLRLPFYTHAWLVSPLALAFTLYDTVHTYLPKLSALLAGLCGLLLLWYARAVIHTLRQAGGYRLLPACLAFVGGLVLTLLIAFGAIIFMVIDPADIGLVINR